MNAENQIREIFETVRHALPTSICHRLKFLPPRPFSKSGSKIIRGRILGSSSGKIWDPKWCFYEIGIGFYPAASVKSVGAIGFVSYPSNKVCGGGQHQKYLERHLERLAKNDGKFTTSAKGEKFQGAFTYYGKSFFRSKN